MKLQKRRIQVQLSLSYRLSLTYVGANQSSVDLVMAYKSGHELVGKHQTYLQVGGCNLDMITPKLSVRRALISTFEPIVLA